MSRNLLKNEQKEKIAEYFSNPNRLFFEKLAKLTLENGKPETFKLKRLNVYLKPNSQYIFSVPARKYAKKVKKIFPDLPKRNVWDALSGNQNTLFQNQRTKIPRAYIIALAFVYRLSSTELNQLLEASGEHRLYPRNLLESAVQFSLDRYKDSSAYERYTNEKVEINDEEIIENYSFFIDLVKKYSIEDSDEKNELVKKVVSCMTTKKEYKKKYETKTDQNRVIWAIYFEELNKLVKPDKQPTQMLTIGCLTELIDAIDKSKNLEWNDDTFFSTYIQNNKDSFVTNRERVYKYVLRMLVKYQYRYPDEESISLTSFLRNFCIFADYLNIYSSSDIFLRNYISYEENTFFEDVEWFRRNVMPLEENKEKVKEFFSEVLSLALRFSISYKDFKSGDDLDELPENKRKKLIRLLDDSEETSNSARKEDIPDGLSNSFKAFLSGKTDISRINFILLYMFTNIPDKPFQMINKEEFLENSMKELDDLLLGAGFAGIYKDTFMDFVKEFFRFELRNSIFHIEENEKKGNRIEEKQNEFFFDTFTYYVVMKNEFKDNIAAIHLKPSSLIEEELKLLPNLLKTGGKKK